MIKIFCALFFVGVIRSANVLSLTRAHTFETTTKTLNGWSVYQEKIQKEEIHIANEQKNQANQMDGTK